MTSLKSGQVKNAVQSAACQHSFWSKQPENAKRKWNNSPSHRMTSRRRVECSWGDRSLKQTEDWSFLLLIHGRAIGLKICIRVAANTRQQLRDAKIIQSLLIAAGIFAAVAHRLYHSNSLLLFGLSPCIWGTISQRGPCKSSALAFDSLRI